MKFRNTTPYVMMVKYSLVFWVGNLTNCNCVPILLMCSWIPIYLLEYPCDRMVMLIIHTCPRVWDHWLNAPCTLYVWICIYTCTRFWQFQLHWTTTSKPGKIETSHPRAPMLSCSHIIPVRAQELIMGATETNWCSKCRLHDVRMNSR
jgi:hypothetical protein